MEARELRIGNYVKGITTEYAKIIEISNEDIRGLYQSSGSAIGCTWTMGKGIQPIELTDDWLIKFGFEDDSLPERYADMGPVNCIKFGRLSLSFQDGKYYPVRKYDNIQHIAYGIGLEYVHQLQNLYFALTGEELTLIA
ncbi:hypothetical protein SNE25_21105 [Mucilaginibacter sabulilitoris]|uniref:Uncharacterized protein n=1 Tax=Mucilaginibacter sabulilitoris TaxID=1173583 RepID=A0ABZ0TJD0_9SPHI|nr:hypothetical protein [Mucilaginibacter sabulilitoris]WPU91819.1 hypothetical protein SNE25_21105 [Mucilaginibacter sabulilitoris]